MIDIPARKPRMSVLKRVYLAQAERLGHAARLLLPGQSRVYLLKTAFLAVEKKNLVGVSLGPQIALYA